MNFKVEITESAADFILSLDSKMQAKIKGSDFLYELRVKVGSNICRLFYFFWKNKTYIVTSKK